VPSHRLAKIEIDDIEITGYSVAGEETVVAVPQLNVCFDIGKAPDQVISIDNLLLTHGHMDHTAGIAYYLSHRNFSGQTPGTVLAPQELLEPIQQIIDAHGILDGNPIPANLVAVRPGGEYRIKPNIFARAFATPHSRNSVGYTLIEKRKKLKPEYTKLTGPQIVELKKQGIEIDYPLEIPLVTYCGDTEPGDFTKLEFVMNSKILITECTFYTKDHISRAKAGKHTHLNDLPDLMRNSKNQCIVLIHISQRTGIGFARKMLKKVLAAEQLDRIIFLMEHNKRRR